MRILTLQNTTQRILIFVFAVGLALSAYVPHTHAAVSVSNIEVSNVAATSATISWTSNEQADTWVGYAETGTTNLLTVVSALLTTTHVVELKNLKPNTSYTYEVNSQNLNGDTGYMAGLTFKTADANGSGGTGGTASTQYPCGQLAKQGTTIYFLTGKDKVKIPFTSMAAFTGLGYSLSNVKTLDVSGYRSSGDYFLSSASQEHPWCSWMKWKDGTVYYSHPTGAIPVPSWDVFINNGGRADLIVPMNAADDAVWSKNPSLPPLQLNDSRML